MALSISCTPDKALEECARVITVVLNDTDRNPACLYSLVFDFPKGTEYTYEVSPEDLADGQTTPADYLLDGVVKWVLPEVPYKFVIKTDEPGTVTILGRKYCPPTGTTYTIRDDGVPVETTEEGGTVTAIIIDPPETDLVASTTFGFEVLECNDRNARIAGIGTGAGVTTIALMVTAGTTLGGEVGSVGGLAGVLIGLGIGALGGLATYAIVRPECCEVQPNLPGGQGQRVYP